MLIKKALYAYAITQKRISERFRFGIHINVGRTLDTSENQLRGSNICEFPDSKVHGTNMGPLWGRQDPGGPHVGPMNFAIWVMTQ